VNWKYLFLYNYAYWNLILKYFEISLQHYEEKKYLSIKIQYCVQKYCVWREPYEVQKFNLNEIILVYLFLRQDESTIFWSWDIVLILAPSKGKQGFVFN